MEPKTNTTQATKPAKPAKPTVLYKWHDGKYRTADLAGLYAGATAWFACPGPSLACPELYGPRDLGLPGSVVFAINTAYPRVHPDVWVGMDAPACYDRQLWSESFLTICGSQFQAAQRGGRRIRSAPGVLFLQGDDMRPHEMLDRLDTGDFFWPKERPNTLFTAIHVALWMGVKRIILLGCDLGGIRDYHDDRVLADHRRAQNRELYAHILRELPMLRLACETHGRELVSATPGSPINDVLPYRTIADWQALIASEQTPDDGVPVLDAEPANAAEWSKGEPSVARGIVTGCDRVTEWMLPAWYRNVRRHNPDVPLAYCDWGMTENMAEWCRQRGLVYRSNTVPCAAGWMKKPFAILGSPYSRTVWLDTDCEVRRPLDDLFSAPLGDGGFGAAPDGHNPADAGPNPVNSGVLVADRHSPWVSLWAQWVAAHGGEYRGDQEVLNALRARMERPGFAVAALDPRFNWLRLAGPPPADAAILHHTGPAGHEWIRRQQPPRPVRRWDQLADWCRDQFGDAPIHAVELGVWEGETSEAWLRACNWLHLVLVDSWDPSEFAPGYAASGDAKAAADADTLRRAMRRAIERTGFAAPRRRVLRGDTAAMAAHCPANYLDVLFLDADHSYEGVRRDLAAWYPRVHPGGLVAGHDWETPSYPGFAVKRAVTDFLRETGIEPAIRLGAESTWCFNKPDAA